MKHQKRTEMKINLIDADNCYRDVRATYKCTEDNIKEVLKKINTEWDICDDDSLDDLANDLLHSCGYAECEEYGGSTWNLELEY